MKFSADPESRKTVGRLLFKVGVCFAVALFDGRPFLLSLASWLALAGLITAVFAVLRRERFLIGAYSQWIEVVCLMGLSIFSYLNSIPA